MAKAFTVVVMAASTLARLLSISHEMTVRHFRCAEHGELTHVAAMAPGAPEVPAQRANDAFRTQENAPADAHEHCGVAFTIEGSSCTPSAGGAIRTEPPAVSPVLDRLEVPGWVCVLTSAPKTSPPSV